MFIGHFAVALAAKRPAPKASLGTLLAAAQLPDLLWPILLLAGVERVEIVPGNTVVTPLAFVHYPISHSLLMDVVWAVLFSALYGWIKRDSRGAPWVGIAVLSHWVLDVVTHRPDLPFYPGGSLRIGLGLWNSLAATMVVEGLLFVVGVTLYLKTTRARDKTGTYAFWGFVIVLVAFYLGNLFGPPPPSVRALEVTG